jgi:hypothetical protein
MSAQLNRIDKRRNTLILRQSVKTIPNLLTLTKSNKSKINNFIEYDYV